MPYELPEISLRTIDFKPIVFNPTPFVGAKSDPTLLSKSLEKAKAINLQSEADRDAIDDSVAKIRQQLDVSELPAFDARMQQIRDRLDAEASVGNTETVSRFAREEARSLRRDSELQDKITVNAIRKKAIATVNQSNQYSSATKRRFEDLNKYEFKGTSEWEATFNPVKEYTPQQLISLAGDLTAQDSQTKNNTESGDVLMNAKGQIVENDNLARGVRSGFSRTNNRSETTKLAKDMEQTLSDLLLQPEYYNGLKQNFESQVWEYNNIHKKLENSSLDDNERLILEGELNKIGAQIADKNGFIPSTTNGYVTNDQFDNWIKTHITPMFKNMEYENISTTTGRSNQYGSALFAANKANSIIDDAIVTEAEEAQTKGESSVVTTTNEESEENANSYSGFFIAK